MTLFKKEHDMTKKVHDAEVDLIQRPSNLSRRLVMAAGAAGGIAAMATAARAASFGDPDLPPEGAINVTNPAALVDPGPQDPAVANTEPSFLNPPATDVNGMPAFRASFNLAPKRIQNGGWARQITQSSFAISPSSAS
jgi:oxalate decarboxylase